MLFAFVLNVRPSTPSPRSQASAPSFLSTGALPFRSAVTGAARASTARGTYSPSSRPKNRAVLSVEALRSSRPHLVDRGGQRDRRLFSSGRRRRRSRARPRSRRARAPSCNPTSSRRRSATTSSAISPMRRAAYASERESTFQATSEAFPAPSSLASATSFCKRALGSSILRDVLASPCGSSSSPPLGAVLERLRIERLDLAVLCPFDRSRPWSCRRGASSRPSPGCTPGPRRPGGPRRSVSEAKQLSATCTTCRGRRDRRCGSSRSSGAPWARR